MKIQFYTEKIYGSQLLEQRKYFPIIEIKKDEEVLRLNDIIKNLPTLFVKMQKILANKDENLKLLSNTT